MQISVRSYLTAGVALAGASAIALTPISPVTAAAPEALMSRAAVSTASVQLSAFSNPFTPYVDLVGNTIGNVAYIGTEWLSQPFPFLGQSISNGLGYAEQYVTAMTGFVKGMAEWATGTSADPYGTLPAALREAANALKTGNIEGAVQALNMSFVVMFLSGPISLMSLLEIPVSISKNVTAALEAVNSQVMWLGLGFLQNTLGVTTAMGNSAQAILDAIRVGDLAGAVNEAIGAPAKVLDTLINGLAGTSLPGLISHGQNGGVPGLLYTLLVSVPRAIAAAIKPPAPPSLADVASLPEATATLVSLEAAPALAVEAPKVEVVSGSTTPAPETTVETPATTPVVEVTAPEVAPEPTTPIEAEVPATATEPVSTEPSTTAPAEGETTDPDTTVTPVDTKDGNKVVPVVKAGANKTSGDRTQAGLNALSDQVGAAAKNFGDGIKKALGGNRSSSSSSSSTGSDAGGSNE
ncbi:hypothetical protein [Mycolicibacterium sp. 624]|uniref:hypothetical protein n=1 Tax=Mycolicibacterium sp. 624 TaxID=3156314 RepID=UPI00339825B4